MVAKVKRTYRIQTVSNWQLIISALFLGTAAGLLVPQLCHYLAPLGTLFLNAIKMLLVPVITTAIINAILNLQGTTTVGNLLSKALIFYFISMIVAASFGLGLGKLVLPTTFADLALSTESSAAAIPSIAELIGNSLPSNMLTAFVEHNILQIILVSILIGCAIRSVSDSTSELRTLFSQLALVVQKLVMMVMKAAPIGIFAIVSTTVADFGATILLKLLTFVLATTLSFVSFVIIYYGLLLKFWGRMGLFTFLKRITPAIVMAFSTSSSAASLPVSLRCAEENLAIDASKTGFLLPLGSVLNLNGLAIYLTLATIFTANLYGVELSFVQHLTVLFTVVFTALGAGGIPGSALLVMGAALSSVGLPLAAIPLIASVDRLVDMQQTTLNVISDIASCYLLATPRKVEKQEQQQVEA